MFNKHLAADGFEIVQKGEISGWPTYTRTRDGAVAKEVIDSVYVHRQISRMEAAMENDPELTIGTAKELLETICRTILSERGIDRPSDDDMPALVKAAVDAVPTVSDGSMTPRHQENYSRLREQHRVD
jgi:hypothetical protein